MIKCRFENKALIERLVPSSTLKQLRAQWEWNADSAWASIQHIEQGECDVTWITWEGRYASDTCITCLDLPAAMEHGL